MAPAGGQLSPPARLSTWSGDQLGGDGGWGGVWAQTLGRPIQGHGDGREACLGSGWARCLGGEVRGSAAFQPCPGGQPLPANSTARVPPYIRPGLWAFPSGQCCLQDTDNPCQHIPARYCLGWDLGWGPEWGPPLESEAKLALEGVLRVLPHVLLHTGGSVCGKADLVSESPLHL